MSDLTIFILSTGEESLDQCLESIQNQGKDKFKIEIIKDVYPVSQAFNEMHKRCKTPYFIQVDADVILDGGAIDTLYQAIKKANFLIYATYGQLYEEGFGPGGSVRCWKRNIFNIFKFRDVRTTDRDFYRRAMLFGFHRKDVKKVLGIHRPRQSNFLDYWKSKGDVEKWQFLRRPFHMYADGLYQNLVKEPYENRYKILGFLMGVTTSKDRIIKSKNTLHEQQKIQSLFNFLQDNFNQFIMPRDIDFPYLKDIAKRAYRNYSPKKMDLAYEIFRRLFDRDFKNGEFTEFYPVISS